jgi:hypothetical protein
MVVDSGELKYRYYLRVLSEAIDDEGEFEDTPKELGPFHCKLKDKSNGKADVAKGVANYTVFDFLSRYRPEMKSRSEIRIDKSIYRVVGTPIHDTDKRWTVAQVQLIGD